MLEREAKKVQHEVDSSQDKNNNNFSYSVSAGSNLGESWDPRTL